MSATPEVLTALANGAADCHWSFDFWHMAALADEPAFFLPVSIFIFGIGTARPAVIKLCRSSHDAVTALTELCGTKHRVMFCRMGGLGVFVRPHDDPIPYMTGRAGHAFLLIFLIVVRIGFLDGTFDSVAWNVLNQGRLLVFQRGVTVQADPDVFILCPIGLEKGIRIGLSMDAGFPFVVDVDMADSAGLRLQAHETVGNFLMGDGMGVIFTQAEDDDWFHFGIVQIREAA